MDKNAIGLSGKIMFFVFWVTAIHLLTYSNPVSCILMGKLLLPQCPSAFQGPFPVTRLKKEEYALPRNPHQPSSSLPISLVSLVPFLHRSLAKPQKYNNTSDKSDKGSTKSFALNQSNP